ncbi:hypothetical protein LTR37_013575 [Vermiconidia calcicola]|uniref:Uncharacterized protein n=1 Tax=Vermiconidia calcicola TaxID=1690605 RepID=A0ACC3MXN7_9PEZI|nr:hypothetical protein LTR37_013575 [Vermiconidia calcicola]
MQPPIFTELSPALWIDYNLNAKTEYIAKALLNKSKNAITCIGQKDKGGRCGKAIDKRQITRILSDLAKLGERDKACAVFMEDTAEDLGVRLCCHDHDGERFPTYKVINTNKILDLVEDFRCDVVLPERELTSKQLQDRRELSELKAAAVKESERLRRQQIEADAASDALARKMRCLGLA